MLQLYKNIKSRRLELGLTQTALADRLGYADKSMVAKIEGGKVDLAQSKIVAIADALHCDPSELLGWDERGITHPYPVLGDVAAGFGSMAVEDYDGDIEYIPSEWLHGQPKDDFFVLRIKGDSMYPAYMDGDKVFVKKCNHVESGTIAVAMYNDDEATLKRVVYKQNEDWIDLIPINPNVAPKHIEGEDIAHCHILGEAWVLIRNIK